MTYYAIQVIGGNCSGKSALVGSVLSKLDNHNILVSGNYKPSKNYSELMTGGIDSAKSSVFSSSKEEGKRLGYLSEKFNITNKGRDKIILDSWSQEKKVVIFEGFTITCYLINHYINYNEVKERELIVVLLEKEVNLRKDEMIKRSGGKVFDEKRLLHFAESEERARKAYDIARKKGLKTMKFFISNNDDYSRITQEFLRLVKDCLKGGKENEF